MTNFIAQAEARGRQEGHREGLQEGHREGRQEGLADAVLRLLTRKFADVSEDARSRVLSAKVEQLSLWIDRILTASSVEDVLEN